MVTDTTTLAKLLHVGPKSLTLSEDIALKDRFGVEHTLLAGCMIRYFSGHPTITVWYASWCFSVPMGHIAKIKVVKPT